MLILLEAIKTGMSLGIASVKFSVPKSTLYIKNKRKVPIEAKMGPSTYLTNEEESRLVEWIFFLAERGFPITKTQLLDSVQQLVIKLERKTPFANDRPGRHWYEGFLRRHPQLASRVAQNLTHTRASVTEKEIRNWFNEVHSHLIKLNLLNIHPSRVFNCDESAFLLCPKPDQVIVRKGSKSVYKVVNADEKESLTTLFMVNAAGSIVPPMIMYWYKRVPYSISSAFPKGWHIGLSEKGWMTVESFYEYILNCFHPWLGKNNIEFPVILYVDGHSSHLPMVEFCRKVKIELIALYPNATHILQPLDVAVFHPLKNAWKETINNWRLENEGEDIIIEEYKETENNVLSHLNNNDIDISIESDIGINALNIATDSNFGSETYLNEIIDASNLHNEENIETISTQAIDITNTDVSIKCLLQDIQNNGDLNNSIINNTSTNFNNCVSTNDTTPDKLTKAENESVMSLVPSPFKKALFWPKLTEKKKLKEKIPTVATSEEWLKYHLNKENIKIKKQQDIEERRKKREAVKERKKQENELKKIIKKEQIKKRKKNAEEKCGK